MPLMPPYISSIFLFDHEEEATMGVTVDKKVQSNGKFLRLSNRNRRHTVSTSFAVLQQGDVFLEMEEPNPAYDGVASDVEAVAEASKTKTRSKASITTLNTCAVEAKENKEGKSCTKRVSFAQLHIREHSVILGDHPCCTVGLPISLGWEVERETHVNIDEYEATRPARHRHELRLSLTERRCMLSQYSEDDVRRVQRKLHRERRCSGRAKQMFFGGATSVSEQMTPTTTAATTSTSSE